MTAGTAVAPAALDIASIGFWALAAIGGLTVLVLAGVALSVAWEEWQSRQAGGSIAFGSARIDRGMQILDYANEEVLRTLAERHEIAVAPSKIEQRRDQTIKGGAKPIEGSLSDGTTEHIEPHDNLGNLVRHLLRHLDTEGLIDQSADCIAAELLEERIPPWFMEPDVAAAFFEDWLSNSYPDGLGTVSPADLARALTTVGQEIPEREIRDQLMQSLEALQRGNDHLLFLEGEWAIVDGANGGITLERTDLRIQHDHHGITTGAFPMPAGVSITAELDKASLSSHGRTRMVGVRNPIRACILATERDYSASHFRLTPIVVFQRIDD